MKKLLRLLVVATALFAGTAVAAAQQEASPKARSGVVRVKLQPEAAMNVGQTPRFKAGSTHLRTGVAPLDKTVSKIGAVSIRPMLPPNSPYAERHAKYGLDRWYVVTFDEGIEPEQAVRQLAATPGVEISETIKPMVRKEGKSDFIVAKNRSAKAPSGVNYPFNDPRLPDQWHYQNFGNIGSSLAGADINLFKAWETTHGSPDVLVAIIDGGVDYKHEDLNGNMFVNEAELNGTPGVDDDGNGYVDDIYGFNFCTNSGEVYPHSHGTHVAGTVAAVNGNGIGVCGVAGGDGTPNSGVKMISCQVFDSRNGSGDGDFAAAITYACDMGAVIAQCSWGWADAEYKEQAVLDAIDYFTNEARSTRMTGGLCVFATGNSGETGDFYPAAYEKCVAVAAMTSDLRPASYSNNGPTVDITAPGGLLDYGNIYGVLSTLPNNEYGYNEGTSMATPHVSGIAALIVSKYGSPTFVNENLRTQLITSVNDLYAIEGNESYRGNFGAGYIDAGKALVMGDGSAPVAVSDFALAAAQDYVSLTWTIPASNDNNVHSHIIYYSTEAFTASSDLSKISSMVADTKFMNSGDEFTFEIPNLQPMTTYYVAIKAVNRWGSASDLSVVKSVKTNAGPQMTVDVESLIMNSTADAPMASAGFNIGNTADGILKWYTSSRTVSMQLASRPYPVGIYTPYNGTVTGQKVARYSVVTEEYNADEYPVDIAYFNEIYSYIGDTDRTLPNSKAQWFYVNPEQYPEGFNLTQIKIDGAYGQNPIIQVYKGDVTISSAKLLQTVEYANFAYGYPVNLNEQLYFAPGESFWIAVHFEGNQESYPLGVARSTVENASSYSYMSNDMGKTWTLLATALKGSPYEDVADELTWAITARSTNPDWSKMLVLEPSEGTVLKGENQLVTVGADGSRLVNGTYKFNVKISNNQTENNETVIPVEYTVAGNNADVQVPKIVDFGSLLVGQSKTLTVEVFNRGYGRFSGSAWSPGIYSDKINSTSEHFKGPEFIQSGFPARTTTSFEVTYNPLAAGSHTGNITFTDKDGKIVRLVVQGVATEPAKVVIEPAVIDGGTLKVGAEPANISFKVGNEGKYPLEFVFPKFSSETISGTTAEYHKFGYTVASTLDGYNEFAYDGNPELIGGTDITSVFTDDRHLSAAISLGFSFPYYGKNYDKVYVTSFGGVMFAPNEETFRSPLLPDSYGVEGTGLISVYGTQFLMGANSKVEYFKADGKFVVKFYDVLALVYDQEYTPVSMRITLASNGDIEMFYDNYDPYTVFQSGSNLFCGINDPEISDVITITSADMADYWGTEPESADNSRYRYFGTGTAIKFEAPKRNFIMSVTPTSGIVNPGEQVDVNIELQADAGIYAGETFNNIAIITNDPNPAFTAVRVNAVIDGEGLSPLPSLEKEEYNLGDVFRTAVVKVPVTVKNEGQNVLTVQSASMEKNVMSVNAIEEFVLQPGLAKDLIVTVPTDTEGEKEDVIKVVTSAGELSAKITANVIGCPGMTLSSASFVETVASGEKLQRQLVIKNEGNETLLYSITPDPVIRMTLPENADAQTSYKYSFSGDDTSVKFDWMDIETTGLGIQNPMSYYNEHDYIEVQLPFEFSFYGNKYSKMYVYNTGFISFTERHDDKIWPEPPSDFPLGTVYTNIIAPYWGLHSMDQTKTAGTFHYVTNDYAVVSFMEYGNSMNLGVCFQVILYKDGTFKYQYKARDENAIIYNIFGVAGIVNEDASDYVKLPERMVSFNSAVSFYPIVESPVKPGVSETVALDFDTDRMAGLYETELKIKTNIPGSENMKVPVSLTVTGTAAPVWPANMEVENVAGFRSSDYSNPLVAMGAMYDAPFTVGNSGSAYFTIDNIDVQGPTVYDEWFGIEMPIFMLFVYAPELDWSGDPTGNYVWQQYSAGMPLEVGRNGIQFSVPMMECEQANTPGEYEIPMTFSCTVDGETVEQTVTVKFVVTLAPVMTLDKEEIRVKADAQNSVITEILTIGNEGEYKLNYSISLDPTGVGEQIEEGGDGGIDPWMRSKAARANFNLLPENLKTPVETTLKVRRKARAGKTSALDVPSDFEYNAALYYPAIPNTTQIFNYGSQTDYLIFKQAVIFKAPAEGFNISHIYLPVSIESAENYYVDIKVLQGSDPESDNVLGRGSLEIASQENPNEGRFFVVPLDKNVYLNPNEDFTVVVSYPVGAKNPAYLVAKEEAVVANRYMAWVEEAGWYDTGLLFEERYGSLGFILTCLETEPGETWIKMLTPEGEASLEIDKTAEIKVQINPSLARMEKNNKAVIVIKSNDPQQPVVNYPVILDCNSRPVIDAPSNIIYVKEGQTTRVEMSVTEIDAETFTVELSDNEMLASIADVTASENDDKAVITRNEDGSYTVSGTDQPVKVAVDIETEFGMQVSGHMFRLTATDALGLADNAVVLYEIEHVNREPVASDETISVAPNATTSVISLASFFNDPDGDELTFTFSMEENRYADAFVNGNSVIFAGKAEGSVKATVVASDPAGASATAVLTIKVAKGVAVDDVYGSENILVVNPNPVVDNANVYCGFSSEKAEFTICSASGQVISSETFTVREGQTVVLPMDNVPAGVYLLTVDYEDGKLSATVIKR